MVKSCPIFDKVAKLGKSTLFSCNKDLIEKWGITYRSGVIMEDSVYSSWALSVYERCSNLTPFLLRQSKKQPDYTVQAPNQLKKY